MASRGSSPVVGVDFSLPRLLLLQSTGSKCEASSGRGLPSSVAPHRTQSFHTRDGTRVLCIGRQILIHCTAWKVHPYVFLFHVQNNLMFKVCPVSLISQIRNLRPEEVIYFPCSRSHNSQIRIGFELSFDGACKEYSNSVFFS